MNRGIDRGAIFSDTRCDEHVVELLAETVDASNIERRRRLRRRIGFEDVVQVIEAYRSEPRERRLGRHGDWGKWMVLRVARAYTGMTLAELGEAIGGKDDAAVSTGLRVFDQRLRGDRKLKKA